jgi:hypothetical protein
MIFGLGLKWASGTAGNWRSVARSNCARGIVEPALMSMSGPTAQRKSKASWIALAGVFALLSLTASWSCGEKSSKTTELYLVKDKSGGLGVYYSDSETRVVSKLEGVGGSAAKSPYSIPFEHVSLKPDAASYSEISSQLFGSITKESVDLVSGLGAVRVRRRGQSVFVELRPRWNDWEKVNSIQP